MTVTRDHAPLYEALAAHAQLRARSFHVPGHKQHAPWGEVGAPPYYYDSILEIDVTELSDTDDLHHPEGPIADAQKLAADCYDTEETRFLVGGSTAGNLAMILGVCHSGDLVILQRNVHKSIIHGLMLAGVRAVLLPSAIDASSGLATIPEERLLREALEKYRGEAKAVILSSPNYYGMSHDLTPLVRLAHEIHVPVLVDEAHGPHFGFHPAFPETALRAGADVVVQSTHKMLSAMTMGAMLHMQGALVPRNAVRQALTMVQSSSPSFPIMASLDLARRQLHTQGAEMFRSAMEAVKQATRGLSETTYRALGYGEYASEGIAYDPLKLVLFDESGGLSGFELRDELIRRKCIPEMADARYVVLAFGPGSTWEDGDRLSDALREISQASPNGREKGNKLTDRTRTASSSLETYVVPDPVIFAREGFESHAIELADSAGYRSAEWIIPYPPGIPMLYPGEVITEEIIEQLRRWRHEGAQIQGAQDPELGTLQVKTNL
ncbi:aminotransferase class I/II-fold pyridoxal phosphate-dependent enzyme [Cohnella lupini]|uniref:Arginine/lysine/ornithine decarboxylase n=1 Tax=Cohnella lupini TaxID=1294267 RepID=A0A3D9HQ86_9BACL|nr:aminotransferase class I/II-fold pyridoxal phosphate-dependent enzyme [Cohnella lupini]RED51667.1 arginine/lysine/ornithine decarboxylase [Cohnella lupini]